MRPYSLPNVAVTAPTGSSYHGISETPTPSSHQHELEVNTTTASSHPTLQESYFRSHHSGSDKTREDEELETHSDLWFEDGSVVLRAENTLFKVHISQLSRHSTFFRDMFSLPQPPTKGDSSCGSSPLTSNGDGNGKESRWDGCPLVYLHDKAEDVGNLITALYDGPYVVQVFYSAFTLLKFNNTCLFREL
jgi:hypothetical protein